MGINGGRNEFAEGFCGAVIIDIRHRHSVYEHGGFKGGKLLSDKMEFGTSD